MTERIIAVNSLLTPSVTVAEDHSWRGQRVESYRLKHIRGISLGFCDLIGTVSVVPDEMYLTWATLFEEYAAAFVISNDDQKRFLNVPCAHTDRDEEPVYDWLIEHRDEYPAGFAFMAAYFYAWSADGTLDDVKELLAARTDPGITYRESDRTFRSAESFAHPCYPFTPWTEYPVGFDTVRAMNAMYNYTVDGSWQGGLRFPSRPVSESQARSMYWLLNYKHRTLDPIHESLRSRRLPEVIPPITDSPKPRLSPEQVPVFYYPLDLRSSSISHYENGGFMVDLHRARVVDGSIRPHLRTQRERQLAIDFIADDEQARQWNLVLDEIIENNPLFKKPRTPYRLYMLLFAMFARCGFSRDKMADLMLFRGDLTEKDILNEPAILLAAFESGNLDIIDALVENPSLDRLLTINLFNLNSKSAERGQW